MKERHQRSTHRSTQIYPEYHPAISAQPMIPESARAEFWPTTSPRRVGLASCARRGAEGSFLCSLSSRFSGGEGGVGSLPRAYPSPGRAGGTESPVHLIQGLLHRRLAAPEHGSGFLPGRLDVGDIQGVSEFPLARIAGMRDQVDFGETRGSHIPAIGFHRDMVFEQMARLGATVDPPLPLGLVRLQSAVDLPGTNRQQLLLDLWADSEPLADPGHPD